MIIKVFIVDDHYMVIEGIHSLLQNEKSIEWSGHATNAVSCLAFLQQQQPDVILMDINLPDKSGIDLCKQVKEKYPSIFIIGLSTFNQLSFIQKMMDSGASGYVLKNASQTELMEAIETVAKGKIYFSDEASKTLQKNEATHIILTRREKEVLELIAEGMTNNVIGQKLFISTATVDTHRKNLLAKLNAKNTASLVRMATQLQLI
ncbi:MAG: response regulator transcription factor [Chitinophagaceae bacterium]|jgi:DNA-binding NarL/FixJ family response regulator|nr:response regulator transcription factor [Chitinophagaceae bacterium]MBK7679233.1 response regulator transcription factor [Chitinophagaceae bacterium]MBK8299427.1 response regulator transcription factor [Chitinophagaceae bacterium]MBK9463476.1 response regulator transcription factor [Chitinophagaceae bacterium]MBL0067856.1 response regulator transcription factor [Chitinophagaceae bacterium]